MGACSSIKSSPEERRRDAMIDLELRKAEEKDNSILKLLLLGGGGSGKSTLFKQMIRLYGEGFSKSELESYTPLVYSNIIKSMQELIFQSETFSHESKRYRISRKLENDVEAIMRLDYTDEQQLDKKTAERIERLWEDKGIQATYGIRHRYQLQDSADYFFDKVAIIALTGYQCTVEDLMRIRTPTTGVTENRFKIEGNSFRMFDVGGQRSERKKWIHCFENVNAVLFVVSLNAFNQKLYEDANTNRMVESLALFNYIANLEYFQKTSIMLFLNKRDLFADKILQYPITDCPALKHYTGDTSSFEDTTNFIATQFVQLNKTPKEIYIHITCATDHKNVDFVFNSVKDTILKQQLDSAIPGWRDDD